MEQNNLANLRHTLAHLLAQAVIEHYPNTQLTLGPAVDNGFYYDMDFQSTKITDADLEKIEVSMRKNLPNWTEFTHKTVSIDEAKQVFAGNPYKIELIEEIAERGEEITLYTSGGFTDLCRGGHCEHPNTDIPSDCFKLDRIAGAYWRGNENNKMLTRVYGLAFENKDLLDAYIVQQAEAEKRDHRKLGTQMKLFTLESSKRCITLEINLTQPTTEMLTTTSLPLKCGSPYYQLIFLVNPTFPTES